MHPGGPAQNDAGGEMHTEGRPLHIHIGGGDEVPGFLADASEPPAVRAAHHIVAGTHRG